VDSVKVSKDELLAKLRENREKHEAEYEDAVLKHRGEAIAELQLRLQKIEAGGKIDLSFNLPTPKEFLESFDEAISMLEWEQSDEIELDQRDFQRYVLNKWEWGQLFAASTSLYNAH
jgi:uncharacterized protein YbjQ (UPF0145 family)